MNCAQCAHFFITWEKDFPYGCKAYEIKAKTAPYIEVLSNTGVPCLTFEKKNPQKRPSSL